MRKLAGLAALCLFMAGADGCKTVYEANRTPEETLAAEPSVGFLRPDHYTILGTRSIRDYIEITYERTVQNSAGMTELQIGIRNRGGRHFWDLKGPPVALSVKTTFYEDPVGQTGPTGPGVYETNWQPVRIIRGDTVGYSALCPVQKGRYYQVRITDLVK